MKEVKEKGMNKNKNIIRLFPTNLLGKFSVKENESLTQMSLEEAISDILANYWLKENPYCGMSSTGIYERLPEEFRDKVKVQDVRRKLVEMRKDDKVSTRHIYDDVWAYPKRKLLELYDFSTDEEVGIYTKQLRLGGSQVEHRFFRRQVLDRYKQDPRYEFRELSFGGAIFIKDEFYLDKSVPEADKISIQRFGTSYTPNGEQVVAVILSDLGNLSLEHQRYWSSFEVKEKCLLDSDYVKTNFEAQFSDRISIFSAFAQEIEEINKICNLIDEPPLFKETFIDNPPREFNWLTKPTRREYNSFVHVLDKIISENINKGFFKGKINLKEEISLEKGKVRIVDKGSITLFEEYLEKYWRFSDPERKNEMIRTFKTIRRMRQKPAHQTINDQYNAIYFEHQHRLIYHAYKAIRTLRLILMNHPKAKSYIPPKWLQEGRIA